MPDNERLWRTATGDLVPDGHPDAELLAYGADDALSDADLDKVRVIDADPDVVVDGELVENDTAGTGDAVNAETGELTAAGEPLPVVEQTDGEDLEKVEPETELEKVEPETELEKPVDEVATKPARRPSTRRK